ncbi:MAG: tRNA pseudouridine(55) synthase TruB [Bacteroidales bacterium]|nr:tRNA pseudouridine(55) synthase TruB [Bacteroidales bacterium]
MRKKRFSDREENSRIFYHFPVSSYNPEGDVILVDKPYRCTSFDIVGQLKYALKQEFGKKIKVGHAGTLDPLATGLLIICFGTFTKKINGFQSEEKEYTGTFKMGATTPSFDLEKEIDAEYPYEHITEQMAKETANTFIGETEQTPPLFSAVRVDGKRAYELAREGEEAVITPKLINIREFEITRFELPEIDFRIVCSKGTYIRSIARDFGKKLQSGAHLTALRRTRIGHFNVANALIPQPKIQADKETKN